MTLETIVLGIMICVTLVWIISVIHCIIVTNTYNKLVEQYASLCKQQTDAKIEYEALRADYEARILSLEQDNWNGK